MEMIHNQPIHSYLHPHLQSHPEHEPEISDPSSFLLYPHVETIRLRMRCSLKLWKIPMQFLKKIRILIFDDIRSPFPEEHNRIHPLLKGNGGQLENIIVDIQKMCQQLKNESKGHELPSYHTSEYHNRFVDFIVGTSFHCSCSSMNGTSIVKLNGSFPFPQLQFHSVNNQQHQ